VLEHRDLTDGSSGWRSKFIAKPGLDCWKSVYGACLSFEFEQAGIPLLRQVGIFPAQLQTYLCMSGVPVGLLKDFHAMRLKDLLKRFVVT
jgi:hypothetical protein